MDFEKIFEKIYLAKIKPCLEESVCSRTSEGEYDSISDYHFQSDMDVAARDAQGMIENLLLNGCPPEMILQWVKQSVKISRLRITRHFKIFLTDYDNAEVKLGPLPKTVFLFFLRHPEGVMFSHLMDHRKELQMIYERVCTNDDPQKMRDSIKRLTDPLDNSISEKCAAVKKAFILNIADNIACNYYISGAQGEKKGIPLDRSLVEWECEL
jgi:aromatic ring-cleaving dioxygenase